MSSNIEIERTCVQCGKSFIAKTTVTKCCSDTCRKRNYKQRKREDKLQKSKVEERTISTQEENSLLIKLQEIHQKEYLSISEACLLSGISRMTLYRYTKKGVVRISKVGRRTIIKRSELDRLLF